MDIGSDRHQRAIGAFQQDTMEAAAPDRASAAVVVAAVVGLGVAFLEGLAELREVVHPSLQARFFSLHPVAKAGTSPLCPGRESSIRPLRPVEGRHPTAQFVVAHLLLHRDADEQMKVIVHEGIRVDFHARKLCGTPNSLEQNLFLAIIDPEFTSHDPACHVVEPFALQFDSRMSHLCSSFRPPPKPGLSLFRGAGQNTICEQLFRQVFFASPKRDRPQMGGGHLGPKVESSSRPENEMPC